MTKLHRLAPLLAVVLLLAGCASAAPAVQPFPAAMKHCHVTAKNGATLGDHNNTLTLQGFATNNPDGMVQEDEFCVLKALKITDAVTSAIESTRALDGTQSGSWGKIKAKWTYHPDNGLRVILTTT